MNIMNYEIRPARKSELADIYRMGFDTWGRGRTLESYLKTCHSSKKYAGGRWIVLCSDDTPTSSALVHDFPAWGELVIRGIGSMATFPDKRRHGFGTRLLEQLTGFLAEQEDASVIFLYADIGPHFYEKRGFRPLEKRHQHQPGSVIMSWQSPKCSKNIFNEYEKRIPPYF